MSLKGKLQEVANDVRKQEAIGKLIASIVVFVLTFVPSYIFYFGWKLLHPEGFWQVIVTLFFGLSLLGGTQILFIVLGLAFIAAIYSTD